MKPKNIKKLSRFLVNLVFIPLFFIIPFVVSAAPNISSMSGSVGSYQSITISGSGFGGGPAVALFDDFESGTVGQTVNMGPGSATYGQWDARSTGGSQYYGDTHAVSGSQSFESDYANYYRNDMRKKIPDTREVFISWWLRTNKYPGTDSTSGINWKNVWLTQDGNTTLNDWTLPTRLATNWLITRNDSRVTTGFNGWMLGSDNPSFLLNEWNRYWVWLDGGTAEDNNTSNIHFSSFTDNGIKHFAHNNVNLLKTEGVWNTVLVNGYGRATSDSYTYFDDVYIAYGPNAQARVEIGNAATYDASTNMTILVPTAWSSTSITATVNVGSFITGQTAYLYVVDANGDVNINGFPVVIGETQNRSTSTVVQPPPLLRLN